MMNGETAVKSGRVSFNAPEVLTYNSERGLARIEDPSNGYLDKTRKWQGIPGIEISKVNGRLWACWYSGDTWERRDNYVILTTSGNGGKTWTDARVIIDPGAGVNCRAFDPVLWTDPNGKMWVFWNQEFTEERGWGGRDGLIGVWGMYTDDASVQDPVWSEPVRLCNNVCMNKPTVTDYGWLLPAYMCTAGGISETADNEKGPCLYKFEGYGKPWSLWSQIGKESMPELSAFCEHVLIRQKNGDLKVVVRCSDGIKECFSSDAGKSWTFVEFTSDNGNVLSTTCSRPFIRRLSSGNQLLVYHASLSAKRNNLTVALSEDDGKSWPYKLLIDERIGVSYPDAVENGKGDIFIIYDRNRTSDMEILLVKVNEDRIKSGISISDSERMTVNNNGQ